MQTGNPSLLRLDSLGANVLLMMFHMSLPRADALDLHWYQLPMAVRAFAGGEGAPLWTYFRLLLGLSVDEARSVSAAVKDMNLLSMVEVSDMPVYARHSWEQ